ncbi:hypothetical protein BGX30_009919 [Mortierella sp. GBA39]|nr:hypothetical protein BGX30_009919 [Mortierella sp. GBA39]
MVKKDTWPDTRVIKLGEQKDTRWRFLDMDDATDEAISYLLDFVPINQLTEFDGAASGIGRKCVLSLRHQHSSLSTLDLPLCPGVPSLAIQSILESFPQLVRLEVDHLNVQDIRNGRPWVCSRLESLSVKLNLRRIETDEEAGGSDVASTAVGGDEKATEKTFIQDQRLVFESDADEA